MVPLTAAVVSFVWSWLSPRSPLARLVTDDPSSDALKVHEQPIPPIGGIGIYLALLPSLVSVGDVLIWLAATGALALGVLDDRWSLAPRTRLGFELLIGATLALSPEIGSGWLDRVVIAVATVVLINAINLYDGLDGLAGGALAVSAFGVGLLTDGLIAYSLGAALVGFLVFNWHPAKLFLGDGGAYLVALAFVAAASTGGRPGFAALLVLLGMAGVVLVDLVVTVIRRARAGAPLFQGDRSHLYDQLVDRGWTVPRVVATSTVVQGAVVGVVIGTLELGTETVAVIVLIGVLIGLVGVAAARGFTSSSRELS